MDFSYVRQITDGDFWCNNTVILCGIYAVALVMSYSLRRYQCHFLRGLVGRDHPRV
jgi:hypothetical protein